MKELLSASEIRGLRARAHALKPVVLVGANGISDGVLLEIDRSLEHHELLKVRFHEGDRDNVAQAAHTLCERLGAQTVQRVGKTITLYRPRTEMASTTARRAQT